MSTPHTIVAGEWTVESGSPVPGHLIVRPRQAVNHLSDLPDEVLTAMGPFLARVMSAIQVVVKPQRIYLLRFGEEVESIHIHLFPRTTGMADLYSKLHPGQPAASGAFYFDWIRRPEIRSQLPESISAAEAYQKILRSISS